MLRRLLLILAFMANSWPAYGNDAPPILLETIVKTLQARDQALESFEARGRLYFGDSQCISTAHPDHEEFVILHKSDGCRENKIIATSPNGKKTLSQWVRDDGKKQYFIQCPETSLDVVDSVRITSTPSSASKNFMGMTPFLNAMTPRGIRLSNLVASGTEIETRVDASGDRITRMTTLDRKLKIVVELSERHDFQPITVRFPKGSKAVVTEFLNVDGFWFPKHGHFEGFRQDSEPYRRCFVIDHLRVNINPPSDRFGLPKLSEGTIVFNETKDGPRGIFVSEDSRSVTRKKARKEFVEKYVSEEHESEKHSVFPSIDSRTTREPDRSYIAKWLLAISIILVAAAIILGRSHSS